MGRIRKRYVLPLTIAQVGLNAVLLIPGILASHQADLLWIERTFVPGLDSLIKFSKRPRVLDIDDAIWLEGLGGRSVPNLIRNVDAVIVGNEFLAEWASKYCRNIFIVPTAIDCQRFIPQNGNTKNGFTIGWTGTSGNFPSLEMIAKPLARFLKNHPDAQFVVVADKAPVLPELPSAQFRYKAWTAATEAQLLHTFDVGLMPLVDNDWTRGKCSFKNVAIHGFWLTNGGFTSWYESSGAGTKSSWVSSRE